jgi:hypothetical protein
MQLISTLNVFQPGTNCYIQRNFKLIPHSRILLKKLMVPQLVRKLYPFYGAGKCITVFTSQTLDPTLHVFNALHNLTTYLCKMHFNIIISYTPPT